MQRRLDVYLAAMGRSGSTLLCDLYSRYPTHWLMTEPWITRGSHGMSQLERVQRFGGTIAKEEWFRKIEGESPLERFYRVYGPILEGLEFFGAKEVRGEFHEEYYRLLQPRKILILVRDIRDVIISLLEKTIIERKEGYDAAFTAQYLARNCQALMAFPRLVQDTELDVLKYEEFAVSETRRIQIDQFLGCTRLEQVPETGNISTRPWEIERHGLRISDKSVYRFRSESTIEWSPLYHEIPECRQYNAFFGYR